MAGSSGFSSSARHQARDILSKPPFRTTPSHPPRPLAGILHALGRALNWAFGRPARWFYRHVLVHIGHGFSVTFGGWWVVVVGAMALGLGIAVGVLIVRRRARISARETASGSMTTATDDPDDIDRRAATAESAGDYETAVRLRFRAGLVRLQRSGLIVNQGAQTGRQLSARLRSPTFDALAGRHELIVYARDEATVSDSTTAREAWPRVLVESRASHGADEPDASGTKGGST